MNPTLIAGFEDVMSFIKSQELRIKNVEQNEKVRELKVQELFLENKKLKADDVYQQEIIQKYNEENTMLHEQIKKLKEKVEAYETITGVDRDDIESHADPKDDSKMTFKTFDEYEEQIGGLEQEILDLTENQDENEKLKEDKRLLYVISKKTIDAHIAEHPEDAVAKEGFASEAEYQAWKEKAMAECLPLGY